MNGTDLHYFEHERRVIIGRKVRLCHGTFAFGETIDPTHGAGMRAHGPVKPGLYRVWRLDHGGSRVMLLALPARGPLRGPRLYDERFVSVDREELKKFRAAGCEWILEGEARS